MMVLWSSLAIQHGRIGGFAYQEAKSSNSIPLRL